MEPNPKIIDNSPHQFKNDEIDIISLLKRIIHFRRLLLKITLIFSFFGVIITLISPTTYTSNIILKPILAESKSSLESSLGGLADLAGITLPNSVSRSEIHPILYPQILKSYRFKKELALTEIYIAEGHEVITYFDYFEDYYNNTLSNNLLNYLFFIPNYISSFFDDEPLSDFTDKKSLNLISKNEQKLFELLDRQLSIEINEDGGYIDISFTMKEAISASQMVIAAQSLLQKTIIAHKAKKANEELQFIEERYKEKKADFDLAQQKLATFRDANKNVNTAIALTELEHLEAEYKLAFNVYSELAQEVESQKIKVEEDTPVFATLQESLVPIEPSNTPKLLIVIIFSLVGFFCSIAFVFGVDFMNKVKHQIQD